MDFAGNNQARMNLLIFDLDGTLIDSKLDLVHSVNAARGLMGLPAISEELVSSYVGNGAPVLMRRALGPEASEADVAHGLEFFLKYYKAHMLDNTCLYPGVKEALDRLRAADVKMAVLTNKPVRISRSIVEGLGLEQHFFQVYGGNSFEQKKPDPIGIETLLSESGARARAHDHGGRQWRGHPNSAQCIREGLRRFVRISARDVRSIPARYRRGSHG